MSRAFEYCDELEHAEQQTLGGKKRKPVINFGAGPAKLPEAVSESALLLLILFLQVMYKAQMEFREYQHTGIGVLEMSHRSKEFTQIINQTKTLFRDLL